MTQRPNFRVPIGRVLNHYRSKNKAATPKIKFMLIAFFEVGDMVHYEQRKRCSIFYKQADRQYNPAAKITTKFVKVLTNIKHQLNVIDTVAYY